MTPCEEELLTRYLTHLNVLGGDADCADLEERYQPVRWPMPPAPRGPLKQRPGFAARTSSTHGSRLNIACPSEGWGRRSGSASSATVAPGSVSPMIDASPACADPQVKYISPNRAFRPDCQTRLLSPDIIGTSESCRNLSKAGAGWPI